MSLQLPFSEDRQNAVLGHLITDPEFFLQCTSRIKPTWFLSKVNGKIFDVMLKFHLQYKRHPTSAEVIAYPEFMAEDTVTRLKLSSHMELCKEKMPSHGLDVIRQELTEWMHSVIFQEGVENAAKLFNNKRIHESYQHVTDLVNKIRETTFEEGQAVSFKNYEEYLGDEERLHLNAYTTGLTLLDRALLEGQGGGLLPGDLTILLAPVHIGKTSVCVTMIKHNIEAGRNILFLAHEGTARDLRQKLLLCMLEVDRKSLFEMYRTESGRSAIDRVVGKIDNHLTFIFYMKPGMNIEDVEPIVRRHHEKLKAQGKTLHLLFDDYPALLGTNKNMKGVLAERHVLHHVYRYMSQICGDLGIHGVVPVQTNRDGSKVNRSGERLLVMEDTGESWGVPMIATNIISLNRQIDGAHKHILTFYVIKCRSNAIGTAVAARTDFAKCITHSDKLGACSYTGNMSMADKIDSYLDSYMNQKLPPDQIYYSEEIDHD